MKKWIIPVFILVCLAQWYFPLSSIWKAKDITQVGIPCLFRAHATTSIQSFSSWLIRLNYPQENWKTDSASLFRPGQLVYVVLGRDSAGYASIDNVEAHKPMYTDLYFPATVVMTDSKNLHQVALRFPFSEFTIREEFRDSIDAAITRSFRDSTLQIAAKVRIYQGRYQVEDVLIGDLSAASLKHTPE